MLCMKLNSQRALEIGQRLFEQYDGDWSRIRAAGQTRRDGVVDLTGEKPDRWQVKSDRDTPPKRR